MTMTKVGDWDLAREIFGQASRFDQYVQKALYQEGQFLRKKMVEGIREQAPGGKAFVPLSPNTLRVRQLRGFRGTKALIVTGELRNGITVVSNDEGVFIGILRTARTHGGGMLVNVADVQENGRGPFLVPMTLKSRRFLGAAGVPAPGAGGFAVVRIPARPFIRPVFEAYAKPGQVKDRVLKSIGDQFGGRLGR